MSRIEDSWLAEINYSSDAIAQFKMR